MISVDFFKNNLYNFADHVRVHEGYYWELIGEKHSPWIIKWRNDPCINSYFIRSDKIHEKSQDDFLKRYPTLNRIDFVLNSIEKAKPIGVFYLTNIFEKAENGLYIGEKDFRGKGLARISMACVIEFGFNHLQFQNLYSKTLKENKRNIALNKKIGFKYIGEEVIDNRNFWVMELKKNDFNIQNNL